MNHQEEAVRSRSPDTPPVTFRRLKSPFQRASAAVGRPGHAEKPRLWP